MPVPVPETIQDALGREVRLAGPARRIVSLVPSETYSVFALGAADRLVGRSRYCVEPALDVPALGGCKDPDVDAIVALKPDLVLANKEENGRKAVQALIDRGVPVHVSFPVDVLSGAAYLRALARLLGKKSTHAEALEAMHARMATRTDVAVPTFVPIWNDPWMTFDGGAYASDVVELCGGRNVFADRPRRYPLAADLGRREAWSAEKVGERDTRYPRITLDEVVQRAPERVLLPNEPHDFTKEDEDALVNAGVPRDALVHVDGKDLFWYGAWSIEALMRVAAHIVRSTHISTPRPE